MYRFVDHTAELELEIEAPTEEGVFTEALIALRELLETEEEGEAPGAPAEHEISVTAGDRPALLAEWLTELVFLAETEGFVPERVTALELAGNELRATVTGHHDEPRPLVKAATYNSLELAPEAGAWRARVVLDV